MSFKSDLSRSLKSDYKYGNKIRKMIQSDFYEGRIKLFGEGEIIQLRFRVLCAAGHLQFESS